MKRILLSTAMLSLAIFFSACDGENRGDHYLFIGTYTGSGSEGIYVYTFNSETGAVDSVGAATGVENPSYLALSDDGSHLYAVNEVADSAEASVSSFSFDKEEGTLSFLNKQSSRGGAPCYVSIDKEGRTVFAGNYAGGSLSAFPVQDDGSLGNSSTAVEHQGSSVNKNRQQSPHVHCTVISPDNSTLFVTDLGTDRVTGYDFNFGEGGLSKEASFVFEAQAGAGPRHLTFHPNGRFAYLINELNGTVVAFSYDEGVLTELQTVSALPDNYEGAVSGADIHVSPDGKFLYASNRQDLNDIVIYSIDPKSGTLSHTGRHDSGGEHPRNFVIDPTGNYLLVANRDTNNIVVLKRDKDTGQLESTEQEIALSKPVCLKMLAMD